MTLSKRCPEGHRNLRMRQTKPGYKCRTCGEFYRTYYDLDRDRWIRETESGQIHLQTCPDCEESFASLATHLSQTDCRGETA